MAELGRVAGSSVHVSLFSRFGTCLVTLGSLALTSAVVANAYVQREQFYPAVVYVTKSNPSMAVIYLQSLVIVYLLSQLMKKLFFGQLRAAEFEHLVERAWYAVTETCLAFTVFKDDFSPKFVALFTILLFLKGFHWLSEERVDFMERSTTITWLFHLRVLSLSLLLASLDANFILYAFNATLNKGPSVQLVFGFEYAILLTLVATTLLKYALHCIDLLSDNPWENKAVFMLYGEVVIGLVKVILYGLFITIMMRIYTLPLFAVRPMYLTLRGFKKALNDIIMSRRAIHNMNTWYPDATVEELANTDNVCIICREEMNDPSTTKKLPCGHIFHKSCLRSWFQRQQTCPTCRLDVLGSPAATQQRQQRQQQQQQPHPQQQPQQANARPQGNNGMPPPPPFDPQWFHQMMAAAAEGRPPPPPPTAAPPPSTTAATSSSAGATSTSSTITSSTTTTTSSSTTTASSSAAPQPPFPPPPPFGLLPPHFNLPPPPFNLPPPLNLPPPPLPPPDFRGLTDAELVAMEGRERSHVEARIRCLRNVQVLLDAAMLEMQQYSNVAARLNASAPLSTAVSSDSNEVNNVVSSNEVNRSSNLSNVATVNNVANDANVSNAINVTNAVGEANVMSAAKQVNVSSVNNASNTNNAAASTPTTRGLTSTSTSTASSSRPLSSTTAMGAIPKTRPNVEPKSPSAESETVMREKDDESDAASQLRRRRLEKFQQESNN